MNKTHLSFWLSIVFLGSAFGCDEGAQHAHKVCNEHTQKMVETGLTSPIERQALDDEGIKIMSAFDEATRSGDAAAIASCQIDFDRYVNQFVALAEKAKDLQKDVTVH